MLKISIRNMNLKNKLVKLLLHLPGANEFNCLKLVINAVINAASFNKYFVFEINIWQINLNHCILD